MFTKVFRQVSLNIYLSRIFTNRNIYLKGQLSPQIHKSYFDSKKFKQTQKQELRFCNPYQMVDFQLQMKSLVPNFFTNNLPIKYCEPIKTKNTSENHLSNSFIHLDIPIISRPQLHLESALKKFNSSQVRIGRIMEAMDSIAGIVGYRHCYGIFDVQKKNPFILVTGSVDSINLFEQINTDHDISMEGYINLVGKTSMQIQINLFQENILKANALFTMICRDSENPSKGYTCPKIIFQGLPQKQLEKARKRQQSAKINVIRRKQQMQYSYAKQPPRAEDIAILHNFFLKHKKAYYNKDKGYTIQSTTVQNTILMHLQQRNVHSKIFGGFLMRQMVQTAWVTGNRFMCGKKFVIEDITNIYFLAPVQIGTQLRITAKVTFSKFNILVIAVQAETYNNQLKQQKLCCHLNVFVKLEQNLDEQVYPKTYQNGILYLSSKNSFQELFKH